MSEDIRNQLPGWSGDFGVEAALNNVRGYSTRLVYGQNRATSTSWEDVWSASTTYPFQTASYSAEILSSSANDTAAGTGARTVTVEGLDANWQVQTETVSMNGAAAVALTSTWTRIYLATVTTAGTYSTLTAGANAGTITIRIAAAGATQLTIPITATGSYGYGKSASSVFTLAAGRSAVLLDYRLSSQTTESNRFIMWYRPDADTVSAPYSSKRVILSDAANASSPRVVNLRVPYGPFTGPCDLWFSALASAASEVAVEYTLVII